MGIRAQTACYKDLAPQFPDLDACVAESPCSTSKYSCLYFVSDVSWDFKTQNFLTCGLETSRKTVMIQQMLDTEKKEKGKS